MEENKDYLKPQPIARHHGGLRYKIKRPKKKSVILYVISIVVVLIIGSVSGGYYWYKNQQLAVGGDNLVKIMIKPGMATNAVGELLESKKLIRSSFAFEIYVRMHGANSQLKSGSYRLSSSMSMTDIVSVLVNGQVDSYDITFYPGATLTNISEITKNQYDVTTALEKAGFSDQEITEGLSAKYTGLLFSDKPQSADLEGYVYGQTYKIDEGSTVRDILEMAFDEFSNVIIENDLIAKFKAQGLNLYQGITLASIVQREANDPEDQKIIAQVFLSRYKIGMMLGSDVTYQYIADKTNQERSPELDSPYNTRKYPGLPPGPISVPGLSALLAVADPADTDYLYFLSGDDDVTYFARTDSEHEQNIVDHCVVKCSTP